MRLLFIYAIAFTFILQLFSCNSDEEVLEENNEINKPAPLSSSFFPLAVGNYWVYQNYEVDTNGIKTAKGGDTLKITQMEIIGTDTVFHIYDQSRILFPNSIWVKDSLGYLVGNNGRVYFSTTNFTDTIEKHDWYKNDGSRFASVRWYMRKLPNGYQAQMFSYVNVINREGKVWWKKEDRTWQVKNKYPRFTKQYVAKEIGIVYHEYFYIASPTIYTSELESYHLE
ncbi:MAG: hypothetical protein ACPGLV_08325 [Bacteroidia bacterium]